MGTRVGCLLLFGLAACGGGDGGGGDDGPDAGVTGAGQPCRADVAWSDGYTESWFYTYDDLRRLVRFEREGQDLVYEYSDYRVVRVTNAESWRDDYVYDADGNLIRENRDEFPITSPGIDRRTIHEYDETGLRTHSAVDVGLDSLFEGQKWYYYDGRRLIRVDVEDGTVDYSVAHEYRADGLLVRELAEYSPGATHYDRSHSYDAENRLATTVTERPDVPTITITYVYSC